MKTVYALIYREPHECPETLAVWLTQPSEDAVAAVKEAHAKTYEWSSIGSYAAETWNVFA